MCPRGESRGHFSVGGLRGLRHISNPGNKKIAETGGRWHGVRVSTEKETSPPPDHEQLRRRHNALAAELDGCLFGIHPTAKKVLEYLMERESERQELEAPR